MVVDVGHDYGSSVDTFVPRVTREMAIRAARIICGLAQDADDAKLIITAIGLPDDIVAEARML